MPSVKDTIGDGEWFRANRSRLASLFKPEWVILDQGEQLRLGYQLKLIGVEWREYEEIAKILQFLSVVGLVETQVNPKLFQARVRLKGAAPPPPPPVRQPIAGPRPEEVSAFLARLAANRKGGV